MSLCNQRGQRKGWIPKRNAITATKRVIYLKIAGKKVADRRAKDPRAVIKMMAVVEGKTD